MSGIPLGATLHGYDTAAVSESTANPGGGQSFVQQQFAEDADINVIARRFGLTPDMPSGPPGGMYGDFTDIQDYQDALQRIRRANDGFMTLPADVRERFGNDPGQLIDFAQRSSEEDFNRAFERPAEPPPVVVPPVADQ